MKTIKINCVAYSIAADLYENDNDRIMLVLPGWKASKAYYEFLAAFIGDKTRSSVLVIDYTGHGESPFNAMEIRPAQHFLEVITAFDWIKTNYPDAKLSVMGTSYGGYMALQLTEYRDFENLVLRAPSILSAQSFYSINNMIDREQERKYRKDKLLLASHPLLSRASKFKGRALVVWHEFDEKVPKETTDKYIEFFKADNYLAKRWAHTLKYDATDQEQLAYKKAITDWLNDTGTSAS